MALVNGALADGGTNLEEVPVSGAVAGRLTGLVTMTIGSPEIAGIGTQFGSELRPGDAVKIGSNVYTVTSIDDLSSPPHLYVSPNGLEDLTSVEAFRDGPLLRVQNGAGRNELVVDRSGLVGIHDDTPESPMSFGASVVGPPCSAFPGGYDYAGWCRADVVSVYETSASLKYGFGMHYDTLEVYSPPGADVQIGARDANGGFVPSFTFSNSGTGLTLGPAATASSWGTPLYFEGANLGVNGDPIYVARYNVASEQSEMRVVVGDASDANDLFSVGTMAGTTWTSNFYVRSNGNYYFSGAAESTRSSKRDIAPFDESALDILDKVELVSFAYKEDSKERPKRVGLIADDAQHPYDPRLTNGGTGFDVNTAAALLIKAVQEQSQLIEKQQREIAALRALVCRDRPKEATCR